MWVFLKSFFFAQVKNLYLKRHVNDDMIVKEFKQNCKEIVHWVVKSICGCILVWKSVAYLRAVIHTYDCPLVLTVGKCQSLLYWLIKQQRLESLVSTKFMLLVNRWVKLHSEKYCKYFSKQFRNLSQNVQNNFNINF